MEAKRGAASGQTQFRQQAIQRLNNLEIQKFKKTEEK